jgi:predicted small secreted protein
MREQKMTHRLKLLIGLLALLSLPALNACNTAGRGTEAVGEDAVGARFPQSVEVAPRRPLSARSGEAIPTGRGWAGDKVSAPALLVTPTNFAKLTSNLGGSRILSFPVEPLALTKQPTLFAALLAARLQPAGVPRIGETSRISGTLFFSAPLAGGMLRAGRDVSSS